MIRILAILALLPACAPGDCPDGEVFDLDYGLCVTPGQADTAAAAIPVADDEPAPVQVDTGFVDDTDADTEPAVEPEPYEPDPTVPSIPAIPDPPIELTRTVTVGHVEFSSSDYSGESWDFGLFWTDPDPYFSAKISGDELYTSSSPEDTRSVDYGESFTVTLSPGEHFTVEFWDEDLIDPDDLIQAFDIGYEELELVPLGGTISRDGAYVTSLSMTISL